jgi:hypothetical protein
MNYTLEEYLMFSGMVLVLALTTFLLTASYVMLQEVAKLGSRGLQLLSSKMRVVATRTVALVSVAASSASRTAEPARVTAHESRVQ